MPLFGALRAPQLLQIAALPYVVGPSGVWVCLITTRGTGKWIVPKGWPKRSVAGAEMAAEEAWQEAGVRGKVAGEPMGFYMTRKRLHFLAFAACRVEVYPLLVECQHMHWPEQEERQLSWLPAADAADAVKEQELAALIRTMADARP